MNSPMIAVYVQLVKLGARTIESVPDIPVGLRDAVRAALSPSTSGGEGE